jgi:hypothetical protein
MPRQCNICHKNLPNEQKKRCQICVMKTDMKFKPIQISSFDNPCGGTNVFKIEPNKGTKKIRLHHILHWMSDVRYAGLRMIPVKDWDEIWSSCSCWIEPYLSHKFRGNLKRGIKYSHGNGISASVEDHKGNLYAIIGVWG